MVSLAKANILFSGLFLKYQNKKKKGQESSRFMNFTYVSQRKEQKKTKNWNWNQNEINIRKEKENPRAEIHTNQKSKRNNNKNLAGVPQKSNGSSACFPHRVEGRKGG